MCNEKYSNFQWLMNYLQEWLALTKHDANSSYWQLPLAEKSRVLTTFITPRGRYCFIKLPFGISSTPEHFQKRMNKILAGLDGVVVLT